MDHISNSPSDTKDFIHELLAPFKISPKRATVLGLIGDLGSGKTTFVQMLGKTLGIESAITSPTFVIEKVYKLPAGGVFKKLIHIDAYRLNSSKEILSLGWEDNIRSSGNLIVVEWADKIEDILPKDTIRIYFSHVNETTRSLRIEHSG